METNSRSTYGIFQNPQQFRVPLFQRPYVWSRELQWQPLWDDVVRLADRTLLGETTMTHFMGAVVLQQQNSFPGSLHTFTVIDGQQRLTTMQLMIDAVQASMSEAGYEKSAQVLIDLAENPMHHRNSDEDQFKVWPTNRDRPAFSEVMAAETPIEYRKLEHRTSTMVRGHEFFATEASSWLKSNAGEKAAAALGHAISNQLQFVVIVLQAEEDAQEIFETLNARGTPLTAADLIKNFIFQRIGIDGADQESAYHKYWEHFETDFWEAEVSSGRIKYQRSSLFFNHWLVAQTARDVPTRNIFSEFKFFTAESNLGIVEILNGIQKSSIAFQLASEKSQSPTDELDFVQMFFYRLSNLDTEVVKPVVIWLLDPSQNEIPYDQKKKAFATLESWLIRRAILGTSNKRYNKVILEIVKTLQAGDRASAGDVLEKFLSSQDSEYSYWPGDKALREHLEEFQFYKKITRARARMILEAIEDNFRGFDGDKKLHEQRVIRNKCTIEHVMPVGWEKNWGEPADFEAREALIHTLGNLTLVTANLNSKLSNGPWSGKDGKSETLSRHTSIKITSDVLQHADPTWSESAIKDRTERLTRSILEIWPVPIGHLGLLQEDAASRRPKTTVATLVSAGYLKPGQVFFANSKKYVESTCEVTANGLLRVRDFEWETPSRAAHEATGSWFNGWVFWWVDETKSQTLIDIAKQYERDFWEVSEDEEVSED
jgi:hypothetical protein